MTTDQRLQNVRREALLNLLSDAETAKVSTAEGSPSLSAGSEFVDLDQLSRGVQLVHGPDKPVMGHILPRSAVAAETWDKIVGQLNTKPA